MTGVAWTADEDEMLKRLVAEHGTKKWALIATKIKGKGSKQCRRRWKNFLNMNAKTCSWSPEEDDQLVQLHRTYGNKWTEISRVFGDRTDNAVKNRWAALVRKHPNLADEEGGSGGGGSSYDQGPPTSKRQRVGEPSTGAFQPYSCGSQGAFSASMLGHYNGRPVTSMPTPFDQQLLLQPPPQHQPHLLSAGMVPQQQHHEAPLSIVVNKELLNPWEMTLVQQINQAHAPVHIEVQERTGNEAAAELVTKRSSWRQFVDSLDEPQNQMSDILAWFNNASAANQQLTGTAGRRLTRSLSKLAAGGGADSLTDDHKSLLVRLMSKGLEYRTNSEQAELDLLGGAGLLSAGFSAGTAAALAGASALAEAPGSHRADPLRRTRSARKSSEPEPAPVGVGLPPIQPARRGAGPPQGGGFPGFPSAAAAAAAAAPAGGMARRSSFRKQQQQQQAEQQALPASLPSFGDPFGDVLLTPTFTSQEIAMLIDALAPGGAPKH